MQFSPGRRGSKGGLHTARGWPHPASAEQGVSMGRAMSRAKGCVHMLARSRQRARANLHR
eukprot:365837-Chlamydomonas_euryale.AAC.11